MKYALLSLALVAILISVVTGVIRSKQETHAPSDQLRITSSAARPQNSTPKLAVITTRERSTTQPSTSEQIAQETLLATHSANQNIDPPQEELIPFHVGNRWGLADSSGRVLTPAEYETIWPAQDGMSLVKSENGFNYLDPSGAPVSRTPFEVTWGFTQGLAAVSVQGKFGFIRTDGVFQISPTYDYAWPFENGRALVKLRDELFFIDRGGNWAGNYN